MRGSEGQRSDEPGAIAAGAPKTPALSPPVSPVPPPSVGDRCSAPGIPDGRIGRGPVLFDRLLAGRRPVLFDWFGAGAVNGIRSNCRGISDPPEGTGDCDRSGGVSRAGFPVGKNVKIPKKIIVRRMSIIIGFFIGNVK